MILEKVHDAVYLIDKEGIVAHVNKAATELEDLTFEEIVGKSVSEVYSYTDTRDMRNAPSLNVMKTGIPQMDANLEWFTKDMNMVNAITSSYPVIRQGNVIGSFSISENIRETKKRLTRYGAFEKKYTQRINKKKMRNGTIYIFEDIIGKSEVMQNTIAMAKRFAAKKMPVMIYGETGTGKEMIAQSIHNASPHLAGPFVPLNCAAIPDNLLESMLFGTVKGAFTGATDSEGLFEKAADGTIFLDELNSMPISLQAKILRALQEKEIRRIGDSKTRKINCRIISATNRLPAEAIRQNELREDLFYRLATGIIFVPPLRDRGHDLELLIQYFIDLCNEELLTSIKGISASLKALLQSYYWPGNIRELANAVESAMNLTQEGEEVLDVQHLPFYFKKLYQEEISAMPNAVHVFTYHNQVAKRFENYPVMDFHADLSTMVGEYEQNLLELALASTKGNLTRCAEKLGLTRQGLKKKVDKYQIDLSKYKQRRQQNRL